jgi:hypothetical protein
MPVEVRVLSSAPDRMPRFLKTDPQAHVFVDVGTRPKALIAVAATMTHHYNPPLADAGWSSLVARRAHNPKVVGSNPAPATKG